MMSSRPSAWGWIPVFQAEGRELSIAHGVAAELQTVGETKKRKSEDFIFFGNNAKLKKELKIKLRHSLKKIVKDSYDSI